MPVVVLHGIIRSSARKGRGGDDNDNPPYTHLTVRATKATNIIQLSVTTGARFCPFRINSLNIVLFCLKHNVSVTEVVQHKYSCAPSTPHVCAVNMFLCLRLNNNASELVATYLEYIY